MGFGALGGRGFAAFGSVVGGKMVGGTPAFEAVVEAVVGAVVAAFPAGFGMTTFGASPRAMAIFWRAVVTSSVGAFHGLLTPFFNVDFWDLGFFPATFLC